MMSSEEDTDSFGLYGDKLLKKTKRARQRVDAGEPRNSYSSIPNFSSRPSLMSGGLYGAIYSQNQHNFGLFNPSNYSTTKMFNEFLARQVKQAQDAGGPENNMMMTSMEGASNSDSSKHGFENSNTHSSPVIRRTSSGGIELDGIGNDSTPQSTDLAHHMLRDILQGKKELMALDQELRAAAAAANNNSAIGGDRGSPDNNNSISKNNNTKNSNNNLVKQEVNIKSEQLGGNGGGACAGNDINDSSEISGGHNRVSSASDDMSRAVDNVDESSQGCTTNRSDRLQERSNSVNKGSNHDDLMDEEMICLNSRSDSENSLLSSPGSDDNMMASKDDIDMELNMDKNASSPVPQSIKNEPVALDMKRARVENIVSSMRSSPVLSSQPQVNGCKKRKLYQPQQHDAERYAAVAAGLNLGLHIQGLMLEDDDDEDDQPPISQKRVEKSALETQLRSMQEKLAEMQQKYVQLCNIMEHAPDAQEVDDAASDTFESVDTNKKDGSEKRQSTLPSPAISPMKENAKASNSATNMLSHVMGKMISSKLHNQLGPQTQLPPGFNGTHPLLQHMNLTHGSGHEHPMQLTHAQHPHHAFNNAAAMYLGMGQKFFMEQENRINKESAEAKQQQEQQQHQLQQQQQHQQQQQQIQHQQQLQQQQMQQERERQQQNSSQNQTSMHHSPQQKHQQHQQPQSQSLQSQMAKAVAGGQTDLLDRLNIMRTNTSSVGPMSGTDLEGLADVLKSEITASLSNLVDSIVTRFVHQRRFLNKQSEATVAVAEQLNKDLIMATQLLDRKSPRTKVADRSTNGQTGNGQILNNSNLNNQSGNMNHVNPLINNQNNNGPRLNGNAFPTMGMPLNLNGPPHDTNSNINMNAMNLPPHIRPPPSAGMFQAPKPPQGINPVAAAALYNSMNVLGGHGNQVNQFCMPEPREHNPEQNEALSLVVTPKKKRHKVTDTRITPRTVSRILAQDGISPSNQSMDQSGQQSSLNHNGNKQQFNPASSTSATTPSESPSPRSSYHAPPPSMLPVSLPTSVAIPNPSLHESQVFSPYSPFFNPHGSHGPHAPQPAQLHHMKMPSSPPGFGGVIDSRESPPLPHPPAMLHPALLAAAHHGSSPDYGHMSCRGAMDANDRNSDCNSADIAYDGIQPSLSFSNEQYLQKQQMLSLSSVNSSTLTPMHLRKAKLMFFWVRYPSSAVLKMYFPDIKFNKNNTAQLVKWFSNFREFYYIQMEKYARQAISEGAKSADDLHVSNDCEIYRVLNLHYNRNNHIEVPQNFRYVVEQTLREFFRSIQEGKDKDQSWKKPIYKIISRMDDPVPEHFKSPTFLEALE